MVDIHCHILYGIDDGPDSIEQSMALCRKLEQNGIDKIIATPHFISGDSYMPSPQDIREQVDYLQEELDKEDIDMRIYPGMEVFASFDTVDKVRNNEILSLNYSRYILIEFPFDTIPRYASDLLFSLQLEGYTPVVAHPERYCSGYRKSNLLKELVDKGILLQINSGSILGSHGKRASKAAKELLKAGMVHFIASDSHGEHRMLYDKQEIEKKITRICGIENAERIMYLNPLRVLENNDIVRMNIAKKRFFMTGFLRNLRLNL